MYISKIQQGGDTKKRTLCAADNAAMNSGAQRETVCQCQEVVATRLRDVQCRMMNCHIPKNGQSQVNKDTLL